MSQPTRRMHILFISAKQWLRQHVTDRKPIWISEDRPSVLVLCILRLGDSRLLYYPENENTKVIMETVEVSAKYVCERLR